MLKSKHIFPNSKQRLLIAALVAEDHTFVKTWKLWKKKVGTYEKLDHGSLRLFPLVFKRLSQLAPNDRWLQVARNSHQAHWMKNQLLVRHTQSALQAIIRKKIQFLILKGGAYLPLYYGGDIGARNIEDIDVFVKVDDFFRTIKLLEKHGWVVDSFQHVPTFRSEFFHSLSLRKGSTQIDLHCHALHFYLKNDDWEVLWAQRQKFDFFGLSLWTLSHSDHLLHTCAHGMRYSDVTQLHWVVDTLKMFNHSEVDWERIVFVAQKFQITLQLSSALNFLDKNFAMAVPDWVLQRLINAPISLANKRLFKLHLQNTERHFLPALESYWWLYFKSLEPASSPRQWLSKATMYLQYLCQTTRMRHVPLVLWKRILALLQRSLVTT